ncbi:MAG: cupin domain-containing protein [Coleofasciculus sp. B1-GNL1-01]|uniref:cupin domain-containing protein n=1 Tax=Coleofasciculus sp. B1-GNL1-01 TaxID=3068484 RepID=UPI0032FD7E91
MINNEINEKVNYWQNKGFICEIWTSPPGGGWSDPGHEGDEVFIVLEGEMEISLEGNKYRPKIGEEFFVPAYKSHATLNTGKVTNRFYWIHSYKWSPTGS